MATIIQNVFQLSALSQNDPGAADGDSLSCDVTAISNGTLRDGSFPMNELVPLPIPPGSGTAPPTPTWFLVPDGPIGNTSFSLTISGPVGYPACSISVKASDVAKWAALPYEHRPNQIYQHGKYGIFGFAQDGENGLIYTVTAGVLDPKEYPRGRSPLT